MTYSLLNSVFLGLAFWFFVASMAIIGVQMRRRSSQSADRDVDSLAPPIDARRTPGQRTSITSTLASARLSRHLHTYRGHRGNKEDDGKS